MNWKQQIEAQIADLRDDYIDGTFGIKALREDAATTMQALLDAAVAAEQHTRSIEEGFAATVRPDIARMRLNRALDKLREVSDV
jgi:hypothetical protein